MTGLSAQGHPPYTTNLNLKVKVLDFVKSGGPERTVLRTFRWEVLIQGKRGAGKPLLRPRASGRQGWRLGA